MSSEEDEFFDAPEALGCGYSCRNFSDNEDELIRTSYDFDSQNARRRSRVESIKKNLLDKSFSLGYSSGISNLKAKGEKNSLSLRNTSDVVSPTSRIHQSEVEFADLLSGKEVFSSDQELLQRLSLYSKPDFRFLSSQQENPSLPPYINFPEPSIPNHLSLLNSDNTQKQLMKTQFAETQTIFRESEPLQYPTECTFRPPIDVTLYGHSIATSTNPPSTYRFMHPSIMNTDGVLSHLPADTEEYNFSGDANLPVVQHLRSQVVSSTPEVSNRSADAKHLLDYVKSWSLDAARQQGSGITVNGTAALNRITNTNLPSHPTNQLDSTAIKSLYSTAFNHSQYESMFPQSTISAAASATTATTSTTYNRTGEPLDLCSRQSLRLVSTSVQTDLNLNERNLLLVIAAAAAGGDGTIGGGGGGGGDKMVKSCSATLNSEKQLVNPIEIQFRDRTKSNSSLPLTPLTEQSTDFSTTCELNSTGVLGKMLKIQKYFRGAVSAMKSATKNKIFNPDEESSDEDEEVIGNQGIRLRSSRQARGRREFLQIKLVQEMKNEHTGAIWAMRFSPCGRLLATAGYDRNIRIWVLRQCYSYFKGMQRSSTPPPTNTKYNSVNTFMTNTFNTANNDTVSNVMLDEENRLDTLSLASTSISTSGKTDFSEADGASSSSSAPGCSGVHLGVTDDRPSPPSSSGGSTKNNLKHSIPVPAIVMNPASASLPPIVVSDSQRERKTVFRSKPLLVLRGHEGVVTELAWSKNLFLLATSMDHQVRLWHISRRECLCVFSHNDTVPTIVFHPKDDRYFLSGSLDGKLRLWNIPDKKVRFWVEVPVPSALPVSTTSLSSASSSNTVTSLFTRSSPYNNSQYTTSILGLSKGGVGPKTVITCATFACEGTKVVVGTYDGRVLFFNSELSYITFITIKSGTTKGRHCRVTAIECDPADSNKILVTSNDSRLRLVDARDYHTLCKYRGFVNETSQIRASFSPTGRYLISGSENAFFYIWQKSLDVDRVSRFSRVRKDRNNCWEAIKAHDTMVTVAVFSPNPNLVLDKHYFKQRTQNSCLIASKHSDANLKSHHHYHHRRRQLSSDQLAISGGNSNADRQTWMYLGEVVVSADCNGCIRVFKKYASSELAQSTST
ncbi:unnamed protein product [Trichobilharzia szidati]|nr:unnamed protein product [Trichobilharzia szidati]